LRIAEALRLLTVAGASHFFEKQADRRSGIDLTNAGATLAAMKRRLLFAILLAIVLALLIKYGANAAPRASELPLSPGISAVND
jgi:hypothetical protein